MYRRFLFVYKITVSHVLRFLTGTGCRFTPTCSEYASQALTKYGIRKGTILSLKRVTRCHPWTPAGYDPVP